MNRELKFRAYDKVNSKMLDGVIPVKIQNDQPYMIWGNGMNYLGTYGEQYTMETFIQLGQFEIMQFTGLKDKNGKEIYEGDILNCENFAHIGYTRDGDEIMGDEKGPVIYEGSCFCVQDANQFNVPVDATEADSREVIGNIYESPELLKP